MNARNTLLLVLAFLLLGGGGLAVFNMTRGLRNNNPGNLDDDGENWQGLDTPRNDGRFLRFVSPVYGLRALAKVLENYVAIDGVASTVTAIITRFAPPGENDTAAYIAAVQGALGGRDTVDLSTDLPLLLAAITQHENGLQPYADATIQQALALLSA